MKPPILAATVFGLAAGLAVSTLPSSAQTKGQTPPTTTTPPGGTKTGPGGAGSIPTGGSIPGTIPGGTNIPGNRTPTGPGTIPGRMPDNTQPNMPMPVFLSGKVVLDDGTPPPDSVVIERVCGAKRWPEGYTDAKGRFSFEVGRNANLIPDASIGSWDTSQPNMGGSMPSTGRLGSQTSDRALIGCELRANLAGYQSSAIDLSMHRRLDNPEVGTIILHRLANVEGTTVSFTSLEAPKDAKKLYEKGLKAVKKEKWQDAQKNLEKAVRIYPKYAAAWYELGRANAGLGNEAEARKCYDQSLASDSKYLKPYLQIADLAMKDRNWQELADKTNLLIRLDPIDFPTAYLYNSFAYYSMNNFDAAEKSARDGIRIDSAHSIPKMEHILGVILANKRDYAGAAASLKAYLEHAPNASDAETVRKQLAEVERVAALAAKQPQQQQQR